MNATDQLGDERFPAVEVGGIVLLKGMEALIRVAGIGRCRPSKRVRSQLLVVKQDLLFEASKLGGGVDAQFLGQDTAVAFEGSERFRLAT